MVMQADASLLMEQFLATRSPDVREQLVLQSIPLVHYMLGRLGIGQEIGSEYEDLVHQGLLGLIDAVDRFDPKHGTRFSTYAAVRVRGKVLDYLRQSDFMSRSCRKRVRAIEKAVADLWMAHRREPTEEEIAAHLGVSQDDVSRGLIDAGVVMLSLDASVEYEQEEDGSLHERLVDDKQVNPSAIFEDEDLKQQIIAGLRKLSQREQLLLSLYYYEGLTFKEIGKVMEITESRVCQLHTRAIYNLKQAVKYE